jgi:undecaprenyl-diphosphatase
VKVLPLLTGLALAVLLVLRRRKLEPTLLIGGWLAVAGFLVYGSGLVEFPDVQSLVEDAGSFFGAWTYLVVPVLAFFETGAFVGLITPGETFMIFGGVVAGQGRVDLVTLIGLTWAAAVAGDAVSFLLGRRLGRQFLERHGPRFQITPERLAQVDAFYARHGGKAVLLGRFVGLIRAVSPFLAASGGMRFRRFLPYSIIGAGLWVTVFLVLGYVFWQSFDRVLNYAKEGAFALGTTIVVVVGAIWLWRNREDVGRWLRVQFDRPALRPVARAVEPVWRATQRPRAFVLNRVTPGDLGLEVTSLLAVLAVGSYAFVAPLLALRDGRMPSGDDSAHDIAVHVQTGTLTDVAKVVTDLGALPVVLPVLALAVLVLAWRRDWLSAVVLAGGTAIAFVLVNVVKAAQDRPRPADALETTTNAAYPSAHVVHAVAYVAAAVLLARVLPGKARGTVLVAVAVVVAVVVALTRLYLRVHWLSDVSGGAGLAAVVFALLGITALVVDHLRHNRTVTA